MAVDFGKALDAFCAAEGVAREEVVEVKLYGRQPPIERMSAADTAALGKCEKLSLSSNALDKVVLGPGLRSLRVLSVGRNNLPRLDRASLEAVAPTLTELWISYNAITSLEPLRVLKELKVLFASNNGLRSLADLAPLRELPALEDALFRGNPFWEALGGGAAADAGAGGEGAAALDMRRLRILRALPQLKKLDGLLVSEPERAAAAALPDDLR
jgi:dynein light chain 1, axonemal